MKNFVAIVAFIVTLPLQAAAQGPVEMIAYDYCYYEHASENYLCNLNLATVDGSRDLPLGDGIDPTWSPDGTRIAFSGYSQPGLFVLKLSDWSITSLPVSGGEPAWSPDGTKIAFSAGELYVINADGSNVVQITHSVGFRGRPAWSADGSTIAFDCEVEIGNQDICAVGTGGTNFRRLTFDPGWDSGAAFSPDGLLIAFSTAAHGWGRELVVMNPDGSNITSINGGVYGFDPAWSPDNTRIAFTVPPFVCSDFCTDTIHVVNRDGSGLRQLAYGDRAAWGSTRGPVAWFVNGGCDGTRNCSFDGSASWSSNGPIVSYKWDFGDGTILTAGPTVTHTYAASGYSTVKLTVGNDSGVTATRTESVLINASPNASFTYSCSGWVCTFNGSASDIDGSVRYYFWDFGDGGMSYEPSVTHVFNEARAFTVSFFAVDDFGVSGRTQQVIDLSSLVNVSPVASFTFVCNLLTCTFDGSGSLDSDGIIRTYSWNFGDGVTASSWSPTAGRTYAAGGTYNVILTVTDNNGATNSQTKSVTVMQPTMHIGDLDGTRTRQQNYWTVLVTITVHTSNHAPIGYATVTGSWSSGGSASCVTDANGQCIVVNSASRWASDMTFTVVSAAKYPYVYQPSANHDADGDSDGTRITVNNR